ncbi:MAG: methyltransferase [Phycisphaerales bacterium]|nr:methyltransferase [Phycisphaerales bacterium]
MQTADPTQDVSTDDATGLSTVTISAPAAVLEGRVIHRTIGGPTTAAAPDVEVVPGPVPAGPPASPRARTGKWPKTFPPLTAEQSRISDDFMQAWHEVLPAKYGIVERFNHGYAAWHAPKEFTKSLEIGAGLGEHLEHEHLTPEQRRNYYALELRANMSAEIARKYPDVNAITGDCQQRLDFADGFFDRILAIHVLEHLPDLPAAVREAYRLCNKDRGVFQVVIPCEGSMAYTLARKVSAQRVFEKRYPGQSYRWFIEREHINLPGEIKEELDPYFSMHRQSYFPLKVPFQFCNLCIGLTLRPRPGVA